MEHLGNNIARLRNFRRIPQKEMAAKLRMTQQAYSAVENKAEIDEDLLEKIAEVLDFPVQAVRELDAHSVLSINQQGGNAGSVFYQYNPNEKIQELYERLLKEKDDIIKSKDEVIEMYRKQKNAS
ncbi:helix-turn-helix domain-containing protein [Mucilaginibacter boryungensis]|uniref:Helix-turn-helix transcriptional regulator n=1 Tax=Mucilaginibacter boryungensis TaxID=768480 RepID=A0ABR9XLG3_9SPHI|nr:helix-turn-helix transcriptional regulator [Mucilaginibacter boryungensis]MBE9668116.1 helix-turn-helix transcriptional regulator [Mucilaginibacter boryungensis]